MYFYCFVMLFIFFSVDFINKAYVLFFLRSISVLTVIALLSYFVVCLSYFYLCTNFNQCVLMYFLGGSHNEFYDVSEYVCSNKELFL